MQGTTELMRKKAKVKIDDKIAELQEEERYIMQTAAKFGSFLKASALIPYNDAL